jgi:regulation of enolase protein 1 (concanavalin A-like superfamily)
VRQGHFTPEPKVHVAIMCAALEGPGFEANFSDLKLEAG